nr:hypothetical protein [Tanacetum cinerariifolium]
MSDASSAVTYTSVYTDSEPCRYYREESAETGSPGVVVYGYDGLPMQPIAPPSPDYVSGPEHPPSPDYVPGPEHSPSPVEVPYVPEPEYPEYLAPSDDEPSHDDDDDDDTDDEDESPLVIIPLSQTHLRRARKTVRLEPPMLASMEACIARHAAVLSPSLPVSSPPLPLPSPLTTSLTDTGAPLGYRAAEIRMRALLPSTSRRTDIPEVDMPLRKRACVTTLALRFEVGESFAAGAARQPGPDIESDPPTTLEGVNKRVKELDDIVRQRTDEFEVRFEYAQDGRALLRARVNTLFRDRPDHHCTSMLLDRDAMYAREACACTEDRSAAIAAHVRTLKAHVADLIAQSSSLQTQLTATLGRIEILEARDPKP